MTQPLTLSRVPTRLRWLAFAALSAPFWSLCRPLVEVDDARYAEVPREMAASGHWAVPTLDGMPYVEKPPLPYWLTAASYKAFGESPCAARFYLAVMAALGILAEIWLGTLLFGLGTGIRSGVILSTSALYFFLGHYLTPDLPLTVFLLVSWGMIARAAIEPMVPAWVGPAAWAASALAVLTKGLIGAVFPGAFAAGLAVLAPQSRPRLKKTLLNPAGLLAFCAIALPWFLIAQAKRPDFFHFFFTEQHFQRYLTARYRRGQPWYFFLALLPVLIFPWTAPALLGAKRALSRWRSQPADLRPFAALLWSALVVAFFTPSHSKLLSYILPVFPQAALLSAWALDEPFERWSVRISRGMGAVLILGGLLLIPALKIVPLPFPAHALSVALAAAALILLGAGLLACGNSRFFALAAWGSLAAGGCVLAGLSIEGDHLSARNLGIEVGTTCAGLPLWSLGTYPHGLPFYSSRPVDKLLDWVEELHYAKRDPAYAPRFGTKGDLKALLAKNRAACLVFKASDAAEIIKLAGASSIHRMEAFGPWGLAVLGNDARRRASHGQAGPVSVQSHR